MRPRVFYEGTRYRFSDWGKAEIIIKKVIRSEKRALGDLIFIITSDSYLLEINKEFLNHDYYTDVIAFGNAEGNTVNGEIYISKDTVKRNSINYKVSLKEELIRVIVHGVLHLLGYDDGTKEGKDVMHMMENKWIDEFKRL